MTLKSLRLPLAVLGAFGALVTATPVQASLIAFYPFDTNAAIDVTGNGNNGTFSTIAPTFTNQGYEGNAFSFDGTSNQFITVPVNIDPTGRPIVTFGLWANASVVNNVIRGLISHDNINFDRTIDLDTRTDGTLRWSAFTGPTLPVTGGPAVAANEWVFLAVRHNQNTGQFSFDVNSFRVNLAGVSYGSGIVGNTTIGRNPTFDLPFAGRIDNVFFYDEYLTDTQIDAIRTGGAQAILPTGTASAPEPGTIALLGLIGVPALLRRRR